jgi:hypothetical protein
LKDIKTQISSRQYFFDILLKLNFTNKNKTRKGGLVNRHIFPAVTPGPLPRPTGGTRGADETRSRNQQQP